MGKRLNCVEELAKAANKKLTQGMAEHSKAMSTAKSDEEKANIVRSLACVIWFTYLLSMCHASAWIIIY